VDAGRFFICLALVCGPLVGGFIVGRELRRLRVPAWAGGFLFAIGPLAGLAADWIPLGFWNLAGIGIMAGAGVWIGMAEKISLSGMALMVALTFAGAGALEVVARVQGARVEPLTDPPALVQATMKAAIDGQEIPRRWTRPAAVPDRYGARPYAVHIGDSMIASARFTTQIETRLPKLAHANLGMPGTGTDIQYVELLRWLEAAPKPPVLIVHHLFTGNDVDDIDQDYDFCENDMVVEYSAEGVFPCRHLQWRFSVRNLINQSPPPYVLWVASAFSAVASQAMNGVRQLHIATAPHWPAVEHGTVAPNWEQRWGHFEALMKAERDELKRRKIGLMAVVLPLRSALESEAPHDTLGYKVKQRMLEILARLEIPALDAWEPIADAVSRDGAPAFFAPAQDIHFNDRAYDLYGGWLGQRLSALWRSYD